MKKLSNVLFVFLFVLFAGCEKIKTGEPFYSEPGKQYRVTGLLSFTIDSLRDYRCPRNAYCIWTGDVELYFRIYNGSSSVDTTIFFNNNLHRNNPFTFGRHTFRITEVLPWLEGGATADQDDYRIKMVITEN